MAAKPKKQPEPTPHLAMTVLEFCRAFRISVALYYRLRSKGFGPREMKLGGKTGKTLISKEAADEWRIAREVRKPGETENHGKAP